MAKKTPGDKHCWSSSFSFSEGKNKMRHFENGAWQTKV
jgi:hypothetical protein